MKKFYQYINGISWKQSLIYYFLLIVIFGGILMAFSSLFNSSHVDNVNFGIGISGGLDIFPEGLVIDNDSNVNWGLLSLSILLAVIVLVIKIFFESIVIVKMMKPPVSLGISDRFVLNSSWGREGEEYFTIRVLNETQFTLLQVSIKVVLTSTEKSSKFEDEMRWYFDIEGDVRDVQPSEISIFTPYTPWTLAINSNMNLHNSMKDHKLSKIEPTDDLEWSERAIDIIVTGIEAQDGTDFVVYQSVKLDSWSKDKGYVKHYKEGHFASLPLEMKTGFHRINDVVES